MVEPVPRAEVNASQAGPTSEAQALPHLRLGVLISGSGTNLQAIIDACESARLQAVEIALVVSNVAGAAGLQRALKHRLPAIYLPWREREEGERRLAALLELFRVDLVVLAGWMRILSADFLARFPRRVINLHPALLPDDPSADVYIASDGSAIPAFRGLHAVRQALEAGVRVTGSTVHYVTPAVDAGPVLCRAEVPIQEGDSEETLHERIKAVEHSLVIEAIERWRARELLELRRLSHSGGGPPQEG
ncbi:MAG: phosphoribosylglycinamide formyltransferase [Thermogemmatispora sp.]|uniref:phosphoribosylglycinamide formyltransferase n=1 Tax=Thermogemmatispora sp. TaxID=1968838 RepID=UPI00260AD437|nr:phosphoribosylglycinamide formyltransferase [Thermogemmatispora sp.]MBX5455382.1 phosphoribosylglycinamide formyltransferase [Thermogemmatispora sp.]